MKPARTAIFFLITVVYWHIAGSDNPYETSGLYQWPTTSFNSNLKVIQSRSCDDTIFTMNRLIELVRKIESSSKIPDHSSVSVAKYLRRFVQADENVCRQIANQLPSDVLTTAENQLLNDMLNYTVIEPNRLTGVLLIPSRDTIAIGSVIQSIGCEGFSHFPWSKFDNLYTTTIAEVLGLTTLSYYSGQTPSLFGPSGNWDFESCPKRFILESKPSKGTDAKIQGSIDGFLLGMITPSIQHMKLSDILEQYYAGSGLNEFSGGNRIELFKMITSDSLLKDSAAWSLKIHCVENTLNCTFVKFIPDTLRKFYLLPYMQQCSDTVRNKYSIQVFNDVVRSLELNTNIIGLIDTTLGLNNDFLKDFVETGRLDLGDEDPSTTYTGELIRGFVTHRIVTGTNQEIGVLRDNYQETIAIGRVMLGIKVGLDSDIHNYGIKSDILSLTTVAGLLAQTILNAHTNDGNTDLFISGVWDNSCPPRYILSKRPTSRQGTLAETFGAIDGFVLGELLKDETNLKLTDILKQYYGNGLRGDAQLSSRNRWKLFQDLSEDHGELVDQCATACRDFLGKIISPSFKRIDKNDCIAMCDTAVQILYSKFDDSAQASGDYGCFGDIMALQPTGASQKTSPQNNLGSPGVDASNKLADMDIDALQNKKHCYIRAGADNCLHPALIAALASRGTRGGAAIKTSDGYSKNRDTYGILACPLSKLGSDVCTRFMWDSCDHIEMMTEEYLLPIIKQAKKKFDSWTPERQLQASVAAYETGLNNVTTWDRLDDNTVNGDFSNDVMARAQRLVTLHGWNYTTPNYSPPPEFSCITGCQDLIPGRDCKFYHCVDKMLPCGPDGYALTFGYESCDRRNVEHKTFTKTGKAWIQLFTNCLMESTLEEYQVPSMNCHNVKELAFTIYAECYAKNMVMFCETFNDTQNWNSIFQVYKPSIDKDENMYALDQIRDTVSHCRTLLSEDKMRYLSGVMESSGSVLREMLQWGAMEAAEAGSSTCSNLAKAGDCGFYECFNERFPCTSDLGTGHIEEFELPFCYIQYRKENLFDGDGSKWLKDTQRCLMTALLTHYQDDSVICPELHHFMFSKRLDCYIQSGYCEMLPENSWPLQQIMDYMGYPMITPHNDLGADSIYYRNLVQLNFLLTDINHECHVRGLLPDSDMYIMVYSEKVGGTVKIKKNKKKP